MMQYFNTIVAPLGLEATATNNWKDKTVLAMRLYNGGKLIVAVVDGRVIYTEMPIPPADVTFLTAQDVRDKLTDTIPVSNTVYFTGSVERFGQSGNDGDAVTFNQKGLLAAIAWVQHNNPDDTATLTELQSQIDITPDEVPKETFVTIRNTLVKSLGWPIHVGMAIMEEREPVFLCKIYSNGKRCLPR